jgi:LysM repeat protein
VVNEGYQQVVKRDIFDSSHYLFAQPVSSAKPPALKNTGGTVLEPTAPPFSLQGKTLGSLQEAVEAEIEGAPNKDIEEYLVQSGDSIKSLAEKFGVSIETIAWANDLTTTAKLKVGQKLIILPTSGVLRVVKRGDTVSQLAVTYKAKAQDIIDFNELSDEASITAGDLLMIPGGQKPARTNVAIQPQKQATVPLSSSYFICPVSSPHKITQGLHWFNAVDFTSGGCGSPVFAAAGGQVQAVGTASNSGNYVKILHSNGAITFYGHLAKILASIGQTVSQGQVIGQVGHTGYTIPAGEAGCHLHFDVRFASNPFAK